MTILGRLLGTEYDAKVTHAPSSTIPKSDTWSAIQYVYDYFAAIVPAGLTAGSVLFAGAAGAITQDNANFFWDATNKRLGIGTAVPLGPLHFAATQGIAYIDSISTTNSPSIVGRGARTSIAAPSASQTDDGLLFLGGRGYGATAYSSSSRASLGAHAAENWTDIAQGAYLALSSTPIGSTTRAERVRVSDVGKVGINTTAPDAFLSVNGAASFGGGSAAAPGVAAFGNLDTGLFMAAHLAGLSSEGTAVFQASDTSSITAPAGTRTGITTYTHKINAAAGVLTQVNIIGDTGAYQAFYAYGGAAAFFGYSASGTLALPTATTSGSTLFALAAAGYDGTNFAGSVNLVDADIGFISTENFTTAAHGTFIKFRTTPSTTVAIAEAMRLNASGGLSIGTTTDAGIGALLANKSILSKGATSGIGYATGAGGAVTQSTSRTTGVTLNTVAGSITLVSAAGSASFQTFILTNSAIAATDVVYVTQKSGTDKYEIFVTATGAGSCSITFATTGGTTTEQPVFNFVVIKGVTS